ncbi:MAG: glycine cleavage system protein H [Candidatus Helarchaeota archaeon]
MVEVQGYNLPDELYYSDKDLWAKIENGTVIIGITDFAQAMLEKLTYLDVILREEEEVKIGRPFGSIQAGKGWITLYSPLSGIITEVNEAPEENIKLLNNDCYGEGWIIRIEPSKLEEELPKLFKGGTPEFINWQKEEIERVKKINEELKKK